MVMSKGTGVQCSAPAAEGKSEYKKHSRKACSEGLARLAELETLGTTSEMIAGPKARRPKP